ncbi:4217_t:CDS:2 [Funneliformis geosporum]|uniref:4217_t:CDS:1 n=1 Tax=Funneliformis geosporum TaxID=1117311 RepID=A0A9W4SPW6_9GLOM|nr:4217_t:CDS:2 [Funneliformis geosporum]
MNQKQIFYGLETKEEREKRLREKARDYLLTDEDIIGSPTLSGLIEETLKSSNTETFYNLLEKLRHAPYYDKLVSYKGDDEASAFIDRESIKKFLNSDPTLDTSEILRKLSEEAIEENTMDGYYNLLKSFRKSYDELVKLKQSEDNANDFLEKMTHVVYDRRWEKEIRNNG